MIFGFVCLLLLYIKPNVLSCHYRVISYATFKTTLKKPFKTTKHTDMSASIGNSTVD